MNPQELRDRRLALGFSQADVARRFGVDRSYISHAETSAGYARPWYDLSLRCIEYEERVRDVPENELPSS